MSAIPLAASFLHYSLTRAKRLQRSIMGVALGTSLIASPSLLISQAPSQAAPLAEGRYLYGEATQAQVLGSTYLLFQIHQNQVVGAFYQPSSSFDCFHGTVANNALNLVVVDSYDQTSSPYQVALSPDQSPVADAKGVSVPVQVEGFHPISTLSETDQSILNTCLANYPLQ